MYIILGATGHIGSVVAKQLLEAGASVTVLTRNAENAAELEKQGAQVAEVDVHDTEALRNIFKTGKRLFLLVPPAPPDTNTVEEEQKTVDSIMAALDGSGLEKIVAESTYGAQPGHGIGDLSMLYDMEQQLKTKSIPTTIIRGAYYMSNWDMSLESAKKEGKVHSFYPADFELPMVDPGDIGMVAARLLQEPVDSTGLHFVEGPQQYAISDVADAFSEALGKPVTIATIPRDQWQSSLQEMGFSPEAAASMVALTALTLDGKFVPESPTRGATTLQEYIDRLVNQ